MSASATRATTGPGPRHSRSRASRSGARAGISLIVALAIAALLPGFEHRVHLLAGNGFLVLLLLGCGVMHLFMHPGHGGHAGDDRP